MKTYYELACSRCGRKDKPLCEKCHKQDQFDKIFELLKEILKKIK